MAKKKEIPEEIVEEKIIETDPQENVKFAMVNAEDEEVYFYDDNRKAIKSIEDGTPVVLLERVAEYGINENGKMQTASKVEIDGTIGYIITTRLTFGINL